MSIPHILLLLIYHPRKIELILQLNNLKEDFVTILHKLFLKRKYAYEVKLIRRILKGDKAKSRFDISHCELLWYQSKNPQSSSIVKIKGKITMQQTTFK